MSNQCRSCGRDVNNNYLPYNNAYSTTANNNNNNNNNTSTINNNLHASINKDGHNNLKSNISYATRSMTSAMMNNSHSSSTKLKAKVMFGTVGAIKELHQKEKSSREGTIGK